MKKKKTENETISYMKDNIPKKKKLPKNTIDLEL